MVAAYPPDTWFEGERQSAIRWARCLLEEKKFLILDTETTGVDDRAEVIQIGVIAPNGHVVYDGLVKPTHPIPERATAVHGITNTDIATAIAFPYHHKALGRVLANHTVVVYNADFDRRILRQSAAAHNLPEIAVGQWLCAMEEYARFVGEWSEWFQSFRWQKLPPIPGQKGHSALNDCRATLAVLEKMAGVQ